MPTATITKTRTARPIDRSVADSIDTAWAWREGRRVWFRCGYKSTLNEKIWGSSHWDHDRRLRWFGTVKVKDLLPLLEDHQERLDYYAGIRALGLEVTIPFEAEHVRARARELKALWDRATRTWSCREPEHLTELAELVATWESDQADARRVQRVIAEAEFAAKQAVWALEAVDRRIEDAGRREKARREAQQQIMARRADVLADQGRAEVGETCVMVRSDRTVMKRAQAQDRAEFGYNQIARLDDGRRGILVDQSVRFIGKHDDEGAAGCAGEDHYGPHWCYVYVFSVITATDGEAEAEARVMAEQVDGYEIGQFMAQLPRAVNPVDVEAWPDVWPIAGRVTARTGITGVLVDAEAVLTDDGELVWSTPGDYPDHIPRSGSTRDPHLVGWMRSILAEGERTRVQKGSPPTYFDVARDEGTPPVSGGHRNVHSAEAVGFKPGEIRRWRAAGVLAEFYRKSRPWVAEITGYNPDDPLTYERDFVRSRADYSNANSSGSRGVWMHWILEKGKLYETSYRIGWKERVRKFIYLDEHGQIREASRAEVHQWLRNVD